MGNVLSHSLYINNMTNETHVISSDLLTQTINPTSDAHIQYNEEISLDGTSIFSYLRSDRRGDFHSSFRINNKVRCIKIYSDHLKIYSSLVIENQSSRSITITARLRRYDRENVSVLEPGDLITHCYEEHEYSIEEYNLTIDKRAHVHGKLRWQSRLDNEGRQLIIEDNPIAKTAIVNKSSRNISIIHRGDPIRTTVVLPQSFYECDEIHDLATQFSTRLRWRKRNNSDVIVLDDLKFSIQQVNPTTRGVIIEDIIGG